MADNSGGSKFGPTSPGDSGYAPLAGSATTTTKSASTPSTTTAQTGNLVLQPPFATQLTSLPGPMGTTNIVGGLQRGFMLWENYNTFYGQSGGPMNDGRDCINFLFNPSTVTSDYNVGNASLQAAMLYAAPGDAGNLLSPLLQQTVSFQLYYDRTFELLYNTPTQAVNDPATIGVQADVYQFMQFTGLLVRNSSASNLTTADGTVVTQNLGSATATATTGGIMMMMPCYLYFTNGLSQASGYSGYQQVSAIQTQLQYYGYITEWTVQYTHWTTAMAPMRCVISVNFTMLPPPASNDKTAQATWADATKLQGNWAVVPGASSLTTVNPLTNIPGL